MPATPRACWLSRRVRPCSRMPIIPPHHWEYTMTDQLSGRASTEPPVSPIAVGFTAFAAVVMIMTGAFQAFQGLVALLNDDFYVVGEKWTFSFDLTSWGWVHLIVGVLVAVAGVFVLRGA